MFQTIVHYLMSMSGIIALMGTYMIILGYTRNAMYDNVRKKGIKTEGTVVKMLSRPESTYPGGKPAGYAPVVEFTTINGHYTHVSPTYRNPSPYHVGQKVDIYYKFYKSIHEMALEDDVPDDLPKKLFLCGLLFCGIGYPMVYYKLQLLF
jgi:hypothetical protein